MIFGDAYWEDPHVGPKCLKYEIMNTKYLEIIKESKLEYTLYNRKLDTIANNVSISHQTCKITDYK